MTYCGLGQIYLGYNLIGKSFLRDQIFEPSLKWIQVIIFKLIADLRDILALSAINLDFTGILCLAYFSKKKRSKVESKER